MRTADGKSVMPPIRKSADRIIYSTFRWLGVQVQGQQEQARVLLVAVPYALKAGDAQTIGGLPPSAFVLAAPPNSGLSPDANTAASIPTSTTALSTAPPPASNVTTTGGTVNALPLFTTSTNIQNSAASQTGSGSTAKIGINTTPSGATLDVKGTANVQGILTATATGTATSTGASPRSPIILSPPRSTAARSRLATARSTRARPKAGAVASPSVRTPPRPFCTAAVAATSTTTTFSTRFTNRDSEAVMT